jgi:transposase
MNTNSQIVERVIGFDSHPDSFTAAFVRGPTPVAAVIEKTFNKVPMAQLESWAKKHTTDKDLLVMEASGNSFQVVRTLKALEREAMVLESNYLGKLKEVHANNDKLSAVRIAKAYLAGTAKEVWVPDTRSQERRDIYHAHRKSQKRTTQLRNRLQSYLSDNGVRLKKGTPLASKTKGARQLIQKKRAWSSLQWQVIEGILMELQHAEKQRQHWHSLIAQEVLNDPMLLSMVRLCGIREISAFALGAFIGDIQRFANPRKLVKYIALHPAFDHSGNGGWDGGIGGHGHKELRRLLIQGAQAIVRGADTPLAKWSKKLLARRGQRNLVVAAVARKMTVAIWYLMMGRWSQLQEIDKPLTIKVSKIIGQLSASTLKKLGKKRRPLSQEIYRRLKTSRHYVLDPNKIFGQNNPCQPPLFSA